MRAAILREHGTVPEVAEHPDPTGPDVVQVLAAGMNPVDIRIATGAFGLHIRGHDTGGPSGARSTIAGRKAHPPAP